MRLKEKGIGTKAIIGIVIAVVIVGVVAAVLLITRVKEWEGLPIYPGAKEWELPSTIKAMVGEGLPAGVKYKVYTFEGSSTDVLNWYKKQMDKRDWTGISVPIEESPIPGVEFGVLGFMKGDSVAVVATMVGEAEGVTLRALILLKAPISAIPSS